MIVSDHTGMHETNERGYLTPSLHSIPSKNVLKGINYRLIKVCSLLPYRNGPVSLHESLRFLDAIWYLIDHTVRIFTNFAQTDRCLAQEDSQPNSDD
jgi:hypothetical protein